MKNLTQYYIELGKLAYALVLADVDVHGDARKDLHLFIAKEMHKLEQNSETLVMHSAYALDLDFTKIDQKKADPLHALVAYKNFISKNFEEHDEELIQAGMQFLENISDEYLKQKQEAVLNAFHMEWEKTGLKVEQ